MSDSACSAQPSQFLSSKMRSWSSVLSLVLLLTRLSSGCMPVPGLGPDGHNRGDHHGDGGGDIFSHGEQQEFGFEGFQHEGFGFEFGEGFSHHEEEDGGYERQVRLRHERSQVPVYEYEDKEDREDREEEDYRKVLIRTKPHPGGVYEDYDDDNYRKTQFDYGF